MEACSAAILPAFDKAEKDQIAWRAAAGDRVAAVMGGGADEATGGPEPEQRTDSAAQVCRSPRKGRSPRDRGNRSRPLRSTPAHLQQRLPIARFQPEASKPSASISPFKADRIGAQKTLSMAFRSSAQLRDRTRICTACTATSNAARTGSIAPTIASQHRDRRRARLPPGPAFRTGLQRTTGGGVTDTALLGQAHVLRGHLAARAHRFHRGAKGSHSWEARWQMGPAGHRCDVAL